MILDGRAGAQGKLGEAARLFTTDRISLGDVLHRASAAVAASNALWDVHTSEGIARRQVETLRAVGALGQLPVPLTALASTTAWLGEFAETESLISAASAVAAATGAQLAPYAELQLRALQGNEPAAASLITAMIDRAETGQGLAATTAHGWRPSCATVLRSTTPLPRPRRERQRAASTHGWPCGHCRS